MMLLCNNVSHWLGTNLESALIGANLQHTLVIDIMGIQVNITLKYASDYFVDK